MYKIAKKPPASPAVYYSAAYAQDLCFSVKLQMNAVSRNENTVSLEKVQVEVLSEQHPASVHDKKRPEAVAFCPES